MAYRWETVETVADSIFWAPKSLQMVVAAMKLKDAYSIFNSYNSTQSCLLLTHYSRVRLCATPWTAAYEAPPSLGFSRQEHWSGLPFPSPMHESEK